MWSGNEPGQSEDPVLFQPERYEGKVSGLCIERLVLILALPPETQMTKLLHLFKPQFPHVYRGDKIPVFARVKLEVSEIMHENHSAQL